MLNFVLIIVRSALFLVDICNSYIRLLIEMFIAKRVLSRFFFFSETKKTETKEERERKKRYFSTFDLRSMDRSFPFLKYSSSSIAAYTQLDVIYDRIAIG